MLKSELDEQQQEDISEGQMQVDSKSISAPVETSQWLSTHVQEIEEETKPGLLTRAEGIELIDLRRHQYLIFYQLKMSDLFEKLIK